MNPLHPNMLGPAERTDEIAEILAAGLMRLRSRKSSPFSACTRESSLDCTAHPSGHADVLSHGGSE
jgi:hypothetical protein